MQNVRQIKTIIVFSVVIFRKFLWSWSLCQDRRTFKGQETADVPFCLSTSSQFPSRPAWSMATVFEVTTSFGTFCWNFFRDSIMQVADRPGDISILTHIFVSDNRTVVLDGPGAWPPCSWISALNHHTYLFYDNNHQSHKIFILFVFWANKHLFCLCYCLLVLFFILLLRLYLYKNEKVATVRTQVASAYFDTWKPSCNFLLYLVG